MIRRASFLLAFVMLSTLCVPVFGQGDPEVRRIIQNLNTSRSVAGTDASKSYQILFDAYLQMTRPPMPIGPGFNHITVHAGMDRWAEVAGWAESNQAMAEAVIAAQSRAMFGLPYGRHLVSPAYKEAGLFADIATEGDLRRPAYPYLQAIDTIATFCIAEAYRRMEEGDATGALELMVGYLFVLRSCCDREFMNEVLYSIALLNEALANVRDLVWIYMDIISPAELAEVAIDHIPFLRPDRNRLFMPEGDRTVAAALIRSIFDEATGQPDRDAFAQTFAGIQSIEEPFTRFGAMRRWRLIADIHDSRESSLQRLNLVYDDWWRRWRVQEYDPILAIPTQFSRTNPIRYAAVVFALQNIQDLFDVRNELVAAVNGTAVAVGTAGYLRSLGRYPSETTPMFATFIRKRSDTDPFDPSFSRLRFLSSNQPLTIDTPYGRVDLPRSVPIVYSRGRNRTDSRLTFHSDDGSDGDIVYWPPMKALQRQQGRRD